MLVKYGPNTKVNGCNYIFYAMFLPRKTTCDFLTTKPFKMGAYLKVKKMLLEGVNSFLERSPRKSTFPGNILIYLKKVFHFPVLPSSLALSAILL